MNIYEFRISGAKEWICANTIAEALQFYNHLTDIEISDFQTTDDIVLLPKEEWSEHTILDIDEFDEEGNHPTIGTFEEYMKTAIEVDMIATTQY